MFGGKGGVGKTTTSLACSVAIAKARPGQKILVVSTDPAHSLLDGVAGTTLPSNLTALEIDSATLHARFMELHGAKFKEIAARGTFLDREDIEHFLHLSLPGLDELMAYVQLSQWLDDKSYDLIVVDTAPTGHTLRLLGMPEFLGRWLAAMESLLAKHRFMMKAFGKRKLHDELDQFLEMLTGMLSLPAEMMRDPVRCRFVPVMLAEAMSVAETLDLCRSLKGLSIAHSEIIVNRVMPFDGGLLYQDVCARQASVLQSLPADILEKTVWIVPQCPAEVRGIDLLADHISKASPLSTFIDAKHATVSSDTHSPRFEVEGQIPHPSATSRLLIFAGKGGVGKTTMAASGAAGLAAARGARTLIVSTDPAHSLADCVGVTIAQTPTLLTGTLFGMELDAELEFAKLRDLYRGELELLLTTLMPSMDLAYDREVMERLLDLAPPGLDEVMALIRITELITANKFELIVLDTAPTGHLLRLLELPQLIEQWIAGIFKVMLKFEKILRLPKVSAELVRISRGIKKLRTIMLDPNQCQLHAVTILTEMALAETQDLVESSRRIGLLVGSIILNQAAPPGTTPLELALHSGEQGVRTRFQQQLPGVPQVVVYRRSEPIGIDRLSRLGEMLVSQKASLMAA